MRYSYAMSFESDLKPVHTVRGEIGANSARSAIRRGLSVALKQWPSKQSFRSWVLVVEKLEEKAKEE